MPYQSRRQFVGLCAVAGSTGLSSGLGLLAPLSRAASQSTTLTPQSLTPTADIRDLVQLIRRTPRDESVPTLVKQIQNGLSYQQFLAALFVAASETNDLHILAQVFAAHRISSQAHIEERLLPLFWSLDRVKQSQENQGISFLSSPITGPLPKPGEANAVFQAAIASGNKDDAERAILVMAETHGAQSALMHLWQHADRDLGGTLGHLPIGAANAWRTLSAVGWQHATPGLRYLGREFARESVDDTFASNRERVARFHSNLASDWTSLNADPSATRAIYQVLRSAPADDACDALIEALNERQANAGAIWDAISLTAADLIFRFETGGGVIGGQLIHATTSTNAMRFGFNLVSDSRKRLMILLQAASILPSFFLRWPREENKLRDMNLLADLPKSEEPRKASISQLFETLPFKSDHHDQKDDSERAASDAASRKIFPLLASRSQQIQFEQTARSLLCQKATEDPHDFKFPAALFEDAEQTNPMWRPYLLAASVHALHGTQSVDSKALTAARSALG